MLIFICCTSYRVHSIYVLRLFNDPVAMMFLYLSVNLFMDGYWTLGSTFFRYFRLINSFHDCTTFWNFFIVWQFPLKWIFCYLRQLYCWRTLLLKDSTGPLSNSVYVPEFKYFLQHPSVIAFVKFKIFLLFIFQLLLGAPFLLTNPVAYMVGSFNLGRVFLFEWTVNWRFLSEELFVHPGFHISLLLLHVGFLAIFAKPWFRWSANNCIFYSASWSQIFYFIFRYMKSFAKLQPTGVGIVSQLLLLPLFTANLIGVAFSRSLHYQFYVWYFHTLPYLLWSTPYSIWLRYCIAARLKSRSFAHCFHFPIYNAGYVSWAWLKWVGTLFRRRMWAVPCCTCATFSLFTEFSRNVTHPRTWISTLIRTNDDLINQRFTFCSPFEFEVCCSCMLEIIVFVWSIQYFSLPNRNFSHTG